MTPLPIRRPRARRAFKAAAAFISIGAALTSIVNFARSSETAGSLVRDGAVAWIKVTPRLDTAVAIGDTMRFAATVADQNGALIPGALLTWSTDDPAVASVDRHGEVVARGAGVTGVSAAVGGHVARSRVVVRQAVAHVERVSDEVVRVGEGERQRLEVRATDARGYVIAGRPMDARASDSSVATVDSLGIVSGQAAGRAAVTLAIDGLMVEWPVEVVARPAVVSRVGDTELRAPAGRPLPRPVVIRVTSRRGRPAAGVLVRFLAEEGHGQVDRDTARTDGAGTAAAHWILGVAPGRQHLTVTVENLDSALVLVADAEPNAGNVRYVSLGSDRSGRAGQPLPQPVTVRLTDSLGRALADVPVSWSAEAGTVSPLAARTDTLGEIRARWTLGSRSGRQRLRVQAGRASAIAPFHVSADAAAGAPASAAIVSGMSQTGRVGAPLPARIRVRVRDAEGNPVAGARIRTKAASAAGRVSDTLLVTDSTGGTSLGWTLGSAAGQQQLVLRPEGIAKGLVVTATGRPLAAANIEVTQPSVAATAGRALSEPVRVRVTDAYGNAVSDAPVLFAPRSGTATPRQVMTDAKGRAAARWTMGREVRAQTLVLTVPRTNARAEVTVDVRAAPARVAAPPARAKPKPAKPKSAKSSQAKRKTG